MITCRHCGAELDDNSRYCPYCGTRVIAATSRRHSHRHRNNTIIIVAAAVTVLLISTMIYRYYATQHLTLTPDTLSFLKNGGTERVEIDYDGFSWSVIESPEWLETETHEKTLTVTASPDTTGTDRNGAIVVRSSNLTDTLYVSQTGSATFIGFPATTDTVSCLRDTVEIAFQTDGVSPQLSLTPVARLLERRDGTLIIELEADSTMQPVTVTMAEDTVRTSMTIVRSDVNRPSF